MSAPVDPIVWHYLPELPDDNITVLIATEGDDSDEVLIGYHEDGVWWENPADVDNFIARPVYAWAHAPAKPPRKGTAT